ncbi:hypothetical protein ARZXY2_1012 [Arthrobacter sp. ZXY-2]|nr:hypothetical protein ARZXY2_1012 [Arthrobacter sp. ZXY-2]
MACGHRSAHVYWSRLPDEPRVPRIRGPAGRSRAQCRNGKGRPATAGLPHNPNPG